MPVILFVNNASSICIDPQPNSANYFPIQDIFLPRLIIKIHYNWYSSACDRETPPDQTKQYQKTLHIVELLNNVRLFPQICAAAVVTTVCIFEYRFLNREYIVYTTLNIYFIPWIYCSYYSCIFINLIFLLLVLILIIIFIDKS